VVLGRARNLGIEVVVGDHREFSAFSGVFGALLQYPATDGIIFDTQNLIKSCHENSAVVSLACDLFKFGPS